MFPPDSYITGLCLERGNPPLLCFNIPSVKTLFPATACCYWISSRTQTQACMHAGWNQSPASCSFLAVCYFLGQSLVLCGERLRQKKRLGLLPCMTLHFCQLFGSKSTTTIKEMLEFFFCCFRIKREIFKCF